MNSEKPLQAVRKIFSDGYYMSSEDRRWPHDQLAEFLTELGPEKLIAVFTPTTRYSCAVEHYEVWYWKEKEKNDV